MTETPSPCSSGFESRSPKLPLSDDIALRGLVLHEEFSHMHVVGRAGTSRAIARPWASVTKYVGVINDAHIE